MKTNRLGKVATTLAGLALAAGVVNAPKNAEAGMMYFRAEGVGGNTVYGNTTHYGINVSSNSAIISEVYYNPDNFHITQSGSEGVVYTPIALGADSLSVSVQSGAEGFQHTTNNFSITILRNGGNGTLVRFSNADSPDPLYSSTGDYGFSTHNGSVNFPDYSLQNLPLIAGNTRGNVYSARIFGGENVRLISDELHVAIPEPSSFGLLLAGSMLLAMRNRNDIRLG